MRGNTDGNLNTHSLPLMLSKRITAVPVSSMYFLLWKPQEFNTFAEPPKLSLIALFLTAKPLFVFYRMGAKDSTLIRVMVNNSTPLGT